MDYTLTQEDLDEAVQFAPFSAARFLKKKKLVVKTGELTRKTEGLTMNFIRERTSIPVPQVYDIFEDEKTKHVRIVMEYIEGEQLDKAWTKYTPEERNIVLAQLRDYWTELRQIKGTFIGAIDGAACDDQFFSDMETIHTFGPYKDEAAFNKGLVKAWLKNHEDEPFIKLVCDMQLSSIMTGHEILMTHNDYAARNILVRGAKVVAILDWEFAGYYPEYWEFCKALWRPEWGSQWIKDGLVEKVLDPYLQEAAVIWHTSHY